jgi:hypothetical protein
MPDCRHSVKFGQGVPAIVHNAVRKPIQGTIRAFRDMDLLLCSLFVQASVRRGANLVVTPLLWAFHNARSGVCFPSYERIAKAAGCARSTVAEALKALEAAGVLSWVQRIKRVREPCPDLLGANGWRWRVLRTSNSYAFSDPSPAGAHASSSKSEKETGTPNQEFFSSMTGDRGGVVDNRLLSHDIFWRKEARSAIVPSTNRTEREVMK